MVPVGTPAARAWFLALTLTAIGAAAAAGYALTAPAQYRATAEILVTPVPAADPVYAGLGLLDETSGRRSAAATAAVLVRSPQVADAVRAQLGVRGSSAALLDELDTQPVGSSDVVSVTVEDSSPASAAELANAFVDAFLAQRATVFQSQLTSMIRRDEQLLGSSSGSQSAALGQRLVVLRGLQGQPDPTVRRGSSATAPASASSMGVAETVGIGAGAGLGAGIVAVLALGAFARVRRRPFAEYALPVRGGLGDGGEAVGALVDRLEQRLAAREAALAARERDLQGKIDELRTLGSPERVRAGDGAVEALAARERELEKRVAAVTRRELEVARRAAAPTEDPRLAEREAAVAEKEHALSAREQELAERVAAVTRRELEVARRTAAAAVATPAGHAAEAVPVEAPALAPVPAPPAAAEPGGYNLEELRRAVEVRGSEHPDRVEEWHSYLYFLRDYADPDGSLPGSFDWLVHDTFGELLA